MILNVSGRTDIVAFYMEWFINSLKNEYIYVRNPFYSKLVNKIKVCDIDVIVFCTKNPIPLLKHIKDIDIPFVLQVTLTPYGKDIEPNVPNKYSTIETIKKISNLIESDKIFLRYDPIFINDKYTIPYHIKSFQKICEELKGYTHTIIVSFIDEYKNVLKNRSVLSYKNLEENDYKEIGENFAKIALENGMSVQTCAEERTLFEYGFIQSDCVTPELVEHITGKTYKEKWTSRNNKSCHCVKMYDIVEYNTCKHMCNIAMQITMRINID